jgi:glycosyltransferase involved in cell wall biosynthesis
MSQPIRILELRSVRGTGGGPEKTILQGAARSDPARFAVTVCYLRERGDDAFGVSIRAAGLPVDYVEIEERHAFDPRVWSSLRRLVRERRIDLVHAHEYKTNFLAWLLWNRDGIVPLSTVHGWTGHTPRERKLYYPVDKRLLARFPRLVAVSSQIGAELVRHGASPDRVTTILNGIDHHAYRRDPAREAGAREALGIDAHATVVGAVGRLEPQKRFDLLLEAFASLRPTRPDLQLVIAGAGSQRPALDRLARELRLGKSCLFTGHTDDVAGVHHAFDFFVQSSDYEGTPNAVLESMALETPTVATTAGGTAELMTDGVHGRLVPPGSAAILAAAIAGALADRPAARQQAVAARRRIERELSFDARMRRLEAVYTELVPDNPGPAALAGSYL